MKIGIIGAGNVGGTLGKTWAAEGHEIVYGVRKPDDPKYNTLIQATANGRAQTIAETLVWGDILLLAVPVAALPEIFAQADVSGKIFIDANNRFAKPEDTLGSIAEDIQAMVPDAHVIKAFNTIGANHMTGRREDVEPATMFICGDNAQAKLKVIGLASDAGFDPLDCGPLSNAHLLEALALLWIDLMRRGMGRDIAFRLIQRST